MRATRPNARRAALGWALLALLGLVIAAGASYAASRLTSQSPGLSSEPLTAGEALVPRAATRTPTPTPTATATAHHRPRRPRATPAPGPALTVTLTPTATATATPTTVFVAPPTATPAHDSDDYGRRRTDDRPGSHDDD